MSQDSWTTDSWQQHPISQQPRYQDAAKLDRVLTVLASYPPLVSVGEIEQLRQRLALAECGEAFVLQGGDCAERFQDCTPNMITVKLKILIQMSVVLGYCLRRPIIRIGRIAGQYAKPRSQEFDASVTPTMTSFRGDSVNSFEPIVAMREPDPDRLVQAYHYASMTLNYIRALLAGGFTDFYCPENWRLDFVNKSPNRRRYEEIVRNIHEAIGFMDSISGARLGEAITGREFYTSHEGLLLGLETAMTRRHAPSGAHYNLGAHMLWLGDRTRSLQSAHVEYFRGIANPIGVKLGPSAKAAEVALLVERLNPARQHGKLLLITRLGAENTSRCLPPIIEATRATGVPVVWMVDPMHGNTVRTDSGIKTRDFDDIICELRDSFSVHRAMGTALGGVHFEMTGHNVTECRGGAENITEDDLKQNYETYCDPRLNYSQSLEMAFAIDEICSHNDEARVVQPLRGWP